VLSCRKSLNFDIVLKAGRPILLLLLILNLGSCRDGDIRESLLQSETLTQAEYIPEWDEPLAPGGWIVLSPEGEEIIVPDPVEEKEEIIVYIKRDTISGIAVRSAGSIELSPREINVVDRPQGEKAIYGIAYVSTNRYFGINFDNDIFNNTDYYYTNGIRFDYVTPIFASSPLAYPMLPYRKASMNYHGMSIIQNMYTPTNPDTVMLLEGDRPFAAYLYVSHFKNTLDLKARYRQYSELQIGLIGPGSMGGMVQSQIHDIEPVGWQNQVQNDIVLNYTAGIEKGLYNKGYVDLNIFAEGQLGTLYTNAAAGIRLRAGKFNPYFSMPWLAGEGSSEGNAALKFQYGIFASGKVKMVGYDATLQGGVFNRTSNYTIPAEDIERFVLQASLGVYFSYRQIGIMYEQFYISPEFKNALHHRWGHINLTFCF
jgi:hypothetical protein